MQRWQQGTRNNSSTSNVQRLLLPKCLRELVLAVGAAQGKAVAAAAGTGNSSTQRNSSPCLQGEHIMPESVSQARWSCWCEASIAWEVPFWKLAAFPSKVSEPTTL